MSSPDNNYGIGIVEIHRTGSQKPSPHKAYFNIRFFVPLDWNVMRSESGDFIRSIREIASGSADTAQSISTIRDRPYNVLT